MTPSQMIAMLLLQASLVAWSVLLFASEASGLRAALVGLLKQSYPDGSGRLQSPNTIVDREPGDSANVDNANGYRLPLMMFGVCVWALVPVMVMGNRDVIADVFGLAGHHLFNVGLNCIANGIVLLVLLPVWFLKLRKRSVAAHSEGPDIQAAVGSHDSPSSDLVVLQPVVRMSCCANLLVNCRSGARGFLLAVLPVAAVLVATYSLRSTDRRHELLKLLTDHPDAWTITVVILAAVVLAPLVEELIFRVLLQGWLQSVVSPRLAIVIVAIAFCGVHTWPDMLPLFPLAVVLGTLFYRTRSYVAIIVTHALFNAVNVLLTVMSVAK